MPHLQPTTLPARGREKWQPSAARLSPLAALGAGWAGGQHRAWLNLDSSVGRARMGHWRRVWVGATTQRAPARKEEQRPQACCQWLNRVRSAVTQRVNAIEAEKVNAHKDLQMKTSGQPRNLG